MKTLRKPDWKRPISTGIWGLGYHVQDFYDVVLVSNGSESVGDDSDRLWPFLLMRDGKRDVGAERSLETRCELRGLLEESLPFNNEAILQFREDNLEELLSALRPSA